MKCSIICHLYPIRGRWGNRGDMDRRLLQCFTSCALPARFVYFSMATQPPDSHPLPSLSPSPSTRKDTEALATHPRGPPPSHATPSHMLPHAPPSPFPPSTHATTSSLAP